MKKISSILDAMSEKRKKLCEENERLKLQLDEKRRELQELKKHLGQIEVDSVSSDEKEFKMIVSFDFFWFYKCHFCCHFNHELNFV